MGAVYKLAVNQSFTSRHFLIGGDWGDECREHSHQYRLEVQLKGTHLDSHGYLTDITEVEQVLDTLISRYRDNMLNELPEFQGLNPSIENLARLAYDSVIRFLPEVPPSAIAVKVWEDDKAWVVCQEE